MDSFIKVFKTSWYGREVKCRIGYDAILDYYFFTVIDEDERKPDESMRHLYQDFDERVVYSNLLDDDVDGSIDYYINIAEKLGIKIPQMMINSLREHYYFTKQCIW